VWGMQKTILMILAVALVGCAITVEFPSKGQSKQPEIVTKNSEPTKATPEKLIADPILEKAIRKSLKKPEGKLTKADLEKVTKLDFVNALLPELPKGLEKLTNLTELDLLNNKLTEFPKGLEKLTWLQLGGSANPPINMKGLEKLTQLRYLNLEGNQLTELPKELEKLTKLEKLSLKDNQVTDMKELEKLNKLTYLSLYNNKLTEVPKGLEKLTNLTGLDIRSNPDLTKAQIAELQKALPNCNIGDPKG